MLTTTSGAYGAVIIIKLKKHLLWATGEGVGIEWIGRRLLGW